MQLTDGAPTIGGTLISHASCDFVSMLSSPPLECQNQLRNSTEWRTELAHIVCVHELQGEDRRYSPEGKQALDLGGELRDVGSWRMGSRVGCQAMLGIWHPQKI